MIELFQFLWTKKKYWLIPVTVVLLIIAILIVFVGSNELSQMKSHSTVLSIVFGFLVINIFLNSSVLLYSLIIISGLSILSIPFSNIIEKIWFSIALILSKIVPNVLLSIIFYFLLTPLAFMSKIFKAQNDFNIKNNSSSFFINVDKEFCKDSFRRGW
jgi:hypothetical protein